MPASIRIPSDTGAPGGGTGFGAVCVGGNGGGESAAVICSSVMCLFPGAELCGCGFSTRVAAELWGNCEDGVPGGVPEANWLGAVLGGIVEALATVPPGGTVATRYCFQFCAEPPAC